jgi:pyruvate kinase
VKHLDHKAKIVCTIGPASASEEMLARLVLAGMDVARLNFSHGTHESHLEVMRRIQKVSGRLGRPVAILQDLQGPKIRLGTFAEGPVTVVSGDTFTLTVEERPGDAGGVSTPYRNLPHDVKPGDPILLHDGLIRLEVTATTETDVTCKVIDGGVLADRGGIALPGVRISEPSLTDKDKRDLDFGLEHEVDYVALSFVRDPKDLDGIRAFMGGRQVPVIAKLETAEALAKLREIIAAADGLMVARGDLGVEISAARVPVVQKLAIELCHNAGIPVITATQMLDSMMSNPTPTRAEASDVANAVFDGSDAVMLSVETAFGKHPLKSAETMASIVREAEHSDYFRLGEPAIRDDAYISAQSIARAAAHIAEAVDARVILAITRTGLSARLMSKFRPRTPIVAITPVAATARRLSLAWGVVPLHQPFQRHVDDTIRMACDRLASDGWIVRGDRVVIMAGSSQEEGGANLLRLHTQT